MPSESKDLTREALTGFTSIEKLNASNWYFWKKSMLTLLRLHRYSQYIDDSFPKPKPEASTADPSEIEKREKEITAWEDNDLRVQFILDLTISIPERTHTQGASTAAEAWFQLRQAKEPIGLTAVVDAIWQLYDTRCPEGQTIDAHIANLWTHLSKVTALGETIPDRMFAVILTKSLPSSWQSWAAPFWGSKSATDTVTAAEVISRIYEEDRRRRIHQRTDETANLAAVHNRGKRTLPPNPITCGNCKKPGHAVAQCYSKGGGMEGQGPRQRKKREEEEKKKKKESVNQATECQDVAFTALPPPTIFPSHAWLADSAASSHIANDIRMFSSLSPSRVSIQGVGSTALALGRGCVTLTSKINDKSIPITLNDVIYVPSAPNCLLSLGRVHKTPGANIQWNDDGTILVTKSCKPIIRAKSTDNNIYLIHGKADLCNDHPPIPNLSHEVASLATTPRVSWDEAHRQLSHISISSMKTLLNNNLVTGLEVDQSTDPLIQCTSCIQAKAIHQSFPKESPNRAARPGDLIHSDLWGPAQTASPGGSKYFISFIDDHTRLITVKFLCLKSDAEQHVKNYVAWNETQLERTLKALRCDNGGEYVGIKFWLDSKGIEFQPSAPHSPAQNGAAERLNRTLTELARAMLLEKKLPQTLWAEAIGHAAYIRNRSPTRALPSMTPIEAWTGTKPNLSHLREFGTDVYILDEGNSAKTEPKANKMSFVGFEDGSKAIRYYDARTRKVLVSHNFTFPQPSPPESTETVSVPIPPPPSISSHELQIEGEKLNTNLSPPENPEPTSTTPTVQPASSTIVSSRVLRQKQRPDYRMLHDPGYKPCDSGKEATTAEIANLVREIMLDVDPMDQEYPNSVAEAHVSPEWPDWEKAVKVELDMLTDKGTWRLVDLPPGRKAIGNRWVFTKKFDESGNLSRYKACLVAQGFSQIPGQDYSETFSLVMRLDSLRTLIALAAMLDLEISQMDIKGAYLNGTLEEEIYMKQPDGFSDGTGRVCHLIHTLYGLKQSGREWNKTISSYLTSIGFTRLSTEHAIFIRRDSSGFDIVAIWVDDFFNIHTSALRKEKLRTKIMNKFEATYQGEPKLLLGIEFHRNRDNHSITISQNQYISKIISRFHLADCQPVSTPLPPGIQYQPATDDDAFEDPSLYRSAVRSLMYAAIATHPNITYAVNSLSQFNVKPSRTHWNAVKHILRYLHGTKSLGITYDMDSGFADLILAAFSDSDNGKSFHKKAISGGIILLAGGAIKWIAEKQPIITLSTMEAEYVAANAVACSAKWTTQFISELGFSQDHPVDLFIDNQTAKKIAENPELHKRSQHIDKRYHWIREQIELGFINLSWVLTDENLADIFTKSLLAPRFIEHCLYLGMLV